MGSTFQEACGISEQGRAGGAGLRQVMYSLLTKAVPHDQLIVLMGSVPPPREHAFLVRVACGNVGVTTWCQKKKTERSINEIHLISDTHLQDRLLTSGYTSKRRWTVTGIPARASLKVFGSTMHHHAQSTRPHSTGDSDSEHTYRSACAISFPRPPPQQVSIPYET